MPETSRGWWSQGRKSTGRCVKGNVLSIEITETSFKPGIVSSYLTLVFINLCLKGQPTLCSLMLLLILLKFTEECIISLRKMNTLIPTLKMEMILVQTVMTTWMKQPTSYGISQKIFL